MKPEFLHLEDQKYHLDPIIALDTPSGTVETDDEVLHELHSFYEELYSEHNCHSDVEITDFLSELDLLTIDPIEQEAALSGIVSEVEVVEAIGKLKVGKSSGPDGLIPEFYKHFAPILASLLASCFNSAMERNLLPVSMRCAIITLLFKKGLRQRVENYHPISLTNMDYKILAYILVAHLKTCVDNLIHPSQTAYLPGKFMGTNVR